MEFIDEKEIRMNAFKASSEGMKLKENILENIELLDFIFDTFSSSPVITIDISWHYMKFGKVLLSAQNTLNSIYNCICSNSLADANTLLRKYRDDIFFHLYYVEHIQNIQRLAMDKFSSTGDIDYSAKNLGEEASNNYKSCLSWLSGEVSDSYKMFLTNKNYLDTLKNNPQIKKLFKKGLKQYWFTLTQKLNNYTHLNGVNFLNSCSTIKSCDIEIIINDINWITEAFLVIYLIIKPNIAMSTDYMDYLDCGETPPEGSQYWIAPIIQRFYDDRLTKTFPKIAKFIKEENKYQMVYE